METNSTMASTIRSNAKWPVVITSVLMAITIGSYGIAELINDKSSGGDLYLKNWKTKITSKELRELFNQDIYLLNYGEQGKMMLERNSIETALLIKDAERKKITVTEKEIFDKISGEKAFSDEKGNFDPKKYDTSLGNMYRNQKDPEMRRHTFEKKIHNEILKEKVRTEVIKDVKPNEKEIQDDFHDKFDKLEYEYVTIAVDEKKAPEPSAEEIKKIYDQNVKDKSPDYMTEKQIKAKYIFFPYKKYEVEAPKEEEAQAYYDKNKAEYLEKEAEPADPAAQPKEPKYKSFKSVQADIIQKLTNEKLKTKAYDITDKIHTEMSLIKNDKNEVDIVKAFETVKPANGTFGETTYFSRTNGANELNEKFGDIKNFRNQAFANLEKLTLQRIQLDKGILFYFAYKSDVKEPVAKTLEDCKPMIVTELKEDKAWEIAGSKGNELAKLCEAEGWEKTTKAKDLTPANQKVIIDEAAGKHKSIVTSLLERKTKLEKYLVLPSKEGLPEKEYYVVFYKSRTPATDEKFKSVKTEITTKLESSKKSKAWEDYSENLPKEAGLPTNEDAKK